MTLRLAVLGCAGAAPLNAACSCYAVSGGGKCVLLDCGPGALERIWRFGLLSEIEAIVISHMHADHVLDLLPFAGELVQRELAGKQPALYLPNGGRQLLGELDAVFSREAGKSRFEGAFEIHEYGPEDCLSLVDLQFTFAPSAHSGACFAVRVSDGELAVVYGADGSPSREVEELTRDVDLLILEATYATDAETAQAQGHMTAAQAGALAQRAGARRLLLTHLLPEADKRWLTAARQHFTGPVVLAREGLTYDLA